MSSTGDCKTIKKLLQRRSWDPIDKIGDLDNDGIIFAMCLQLNLHQNLRNLID